MDCVLFIVLGGRAPSPQQVARCGPSVALDITAQAHSVGVKPLHPFSSSFWKAAAKSEKNLALSLAYCFVYFKNFLSVSLCGHQISDTPRHRRDVVLVTASV